MVASRSAITRHGLGLAGALLFLLAWELAARLVWQDPQVLPAPTQAVASAIECNARHINKFT